MFIVRLSRPFQHLPTQTSTYPSTPHLTHPQKGRLISIQFLTHSSSALRCHVPPESKHEQAVPLKVMDYGRIFHHYHLTIVVATIDKWPINGKSTRHMQRFNILITIASVIFSWHTCIASDTGFFWGVNPASLDSVGIAEICFTSKLCYTSSIYPGYFPDKRRLLR